MKNLLDYSQLTWEQLLKKTDDWFNSPRVITEAFKRLKKITEPKYKVYTALLTQVGTNTPEPIILENSIGNITWTREGEGQYKAVFDSTFNKNNIFVNITLSQKSDLINQVSYFIEDEALYITTLSSEGFKDELLNYMYPTSIEIRVYI